MGFLSVLHAIGRGSLKVINVASQVQSNQGAQLIESVLIPQPALKLVNAALNSVTGASLLASQVVHSTELTGPQKMAIAMAGFNQAYQDYAKEAGLPVEPEKAQLILQGAYDLLTKIQIASPAPGGTSTPVSPATPGVGSQPS